MELRCSAASAGRFSKNSQSVFANARSKTAHAQENSDPPRKSGKRGHFYFARRATFLLCLDSCARPVDWYMIPHIRFRWDSFLDDLVELTQEDSDDSTLEKFCGTGLRSGWFAYPAGRVGRPERRGIDT